MAKYVKFMRGTPTAYDNLRIKEADTLYFISETDAVTGKLYIGDKLVNSNLTMQDLQFYLSKLEDVDVSNVEHGDLLGYNAMDQKWIPVSVKNTILAQCATKEEVKQVNTNVQNITNSLGEVITKVENIEKSLNNYVHTTSYTQKMEQIDKDIMDLKKSTTWNKL